MDLGSSGSQQVLEEGPSVWGRAGPMTPATVFLPDPCELTKPPGGSGCWVPRPCADGHVSSLAVRVSTDAHRDLGGSGASLGGGGATEAPQMGLREQPRSRAMDVGNKHTNCIPPRAGPSLSLTSLPCTLKLQGQAGKTLPKPQRKYLSPFWATGSLRQSALFTPKAAQNQ